MKNKLFIFVLTFLIIHCTLNIENCEGQWVQCGENMGVSIYSLTSSGSNIFAGTHSSGVLQSTNNGISWAQTNLKNIVVFSMASSGNKIFAGTYNSLFYSTNYGYSWNHISLNNRYVYSITTSGSNIYTGTSASGVFRSTNNGDNWTQTALNNQNVYSLAINGSNIFAGTYYYGVFLSTNNGDNWAQTALNNQNVSSLAVIGDFIFAGTYSNGVFLTTNDGNSWTQTNMQNITVNSLVVYGENIFAGTGEIGVLLSTNYGSTWIQKNEGFNTTPSISSLLIANNCIFVSSYDKSIWYRSYNDIIGVHSPEIPTEYSLSQNYPNPFNPITNIRYQIAKSIKRETSDVKLIIYNLLGKEVETIINEMQSPGIYEVSWDGREYSSGIYFYSLFVDGNKIDTKRAVLIK
jgi:photosystem II stability/assembly factor-like uncharacterized protein